MSKESYPKWYVEVPNLNPNWITENFLDFMNINLTDLVGKNVTSIWWWFWVFESDAAKAGAFVTVVDPIYSDRNSLDTKLKENIGWLEGKTTWESADLVERLREKVAKTLSDTEPTDKHAEIQSKLEWYDEKKKEVDEYIRRRKDQIKHLENWKECQELYGMVLNLSSWDNIQWIGDGTQDMVVIWYTLSHIHNASWNIKQFLKEGYKLLKNNWKLWIIDYGWYNKEFEKKLEETEFKIYHKVNKWSFACCFDKNWLNDFLKNNIDVRYPDEDLLKEEIFTKEEVLDAALVTHPRAKQINLTEEEIGRTLILKNGSNLTALKNPIIDEYGNEFWCSEWRYMSQRVADLWAKKMIAFLSTWYWLAMKARQLYDLEQDEKKRIEFMRNAIREKFDNNPELKAELLATEDRKIIEYTYWWDTRFWIDQDTLRWKNILWKLLMEYRDNNK